MKACTLQQRPRVPQLGSDAAKIKWISIYQKKKIFNVHQPGFIFSKAGFKSVNQELPDVQAGFWKGKGTRDQIASTCWIIEKKQENSRKTSTSALLTTLRPLTMWITTNWKILQEMGIPEQLPASWEVCMQMKKQQSELDMEQQTDFQIGKRVCQGCIWWPCLFNLYAEYIIRNARLGEAQARIKIAGRNINNLDMQITPPLWQKAKKKGKDIPVWMQNDKECSSYA